MKYSVKEKFLTCGTFSMEKIGPGILNCLKDTFVSDESLDALEYTIMVP